jgi:glycosyltransferase involved in cell wall biosynthesis
MKKILIINSAKKIDRSFFDLFDELSKEERFSAWVADRDCLPAFRAGGMVKNKFFGPETDNFFGTLGFFIILPVLWLRYFFPLSALQRRAGLVWIICAADREKFIFSPLARLLGIGVIWLELPGENQKQFRKIRRLFSRPAELVVFTPQDAEDLAAQGFKREQIHNISLGVNLQAVERQDNLFSSLAKADKPYSFYKNFTVGALCDSDDRRRLEILLQAAKACVNQIPNFRLVIIGQGPESAHWNWLVKKLGLERRVWLVGEQKNLSQWFDDLDLYVVLTEKPDLADLERVLMAASRGLPLLSFPTRNLTDIIIVGQNGLVAEAEGAEALAQKIIAIEADERGRKILGENGRALVYRDFDRQRQLERLKNIING